MLIHCVYGSSRSGALVVALFFHAREDVGANFCCYVCETKEGCGFLMGLTEVGH